MGGRTKILLNHLSMEDEATYLAVTTVIALITTLHECGYITSINEKSGK